MQMLSYNDEKRIKNLKVLEQRTPKTQPDLKNAMKCEVHLIKKQNAEKKFSGVQEV